MTWARMYVPGSAESKVGLPSGCEQCCLNKPPHRHTWVARFRHPKLTEMGKRPTRSKKYAGSVTEHKAFQIIVSWLWARYCAACKICGQADVVFPPWVEEALAECTACHEGSACTFLADQVAKCKTAVPAETEKDAPHRLLQIGQLQELLLVRAVLRPSLANTGAKLNHLKTLEHNASTISLLVESGGPIPRSHLYS